MSAPRRRWMRDDFRYATKLLWASWACRGGRQPRDLTPYGFSPGAAFMATHPAAVCSSLAKIMYRSWRYMAENYRLKFPLDAVNLVLSVFRHSQARATVLTSPAGPRMFWRVPGDIDRSHFPAAHTEHKEGRREGVCIGRYVPHGRHSPPMSSASIQPKAAARCNEGQRQ